MLTRLKAAWSVVRSGGPGWRSFFTGGLSGDTPARPYAQVPAVFACVSVKADAVAALPLMISTAGDQVIESGPMVSLAQCPNPGMTGRAFVQNSSAYLDLFGRVHWVFELDPIGIPAAVYPVSPLQMRPIVDRQSGALAAWKFRAAGTLDGREVMLPLDQVHTLIDPDFDDPHQPWKGLGPRAVIARQIAQLFKADIANESILDNGVAPSGVLSFPNDLTHDQVRNVWEAFKDRNTGSKYRHLPIVATGGAKWDTMGGNLHDMEFLNLKKQNWIEICAAFRVPPPVVGIYEDSNYAHAEAAKQQFYENAVLPRADRIAEEWTLGVLSRFKGDRSLAAQDARRRSITVSERACRVYRDRRRAATNQTTPFFAWMDTSGVGPLQRARLALADQAEKWNRIGVPLNAITRAYDMPWEEFAWGGTWYKPIGQVDVAEDAMPESNDPPGSEDDNSDPAEPRRRSLPASGDKTDKTTEQAKAQLWKQWRASWRGLERTVEGKLKRHVDELRRGTLERLNQQGLKDASTTVRRDLIGEVLFELEAANESLLVKVGKLIRDGFRLGGEQSMQEAADAQGVETPDVFNIEDPRVERKLRTRLIRLTDTNRTLRRRVAEELANGVANGETVVQLSERLRKEFNFASKRATTTARTEVGAAVEEARSEGRRQAGVPMKSWLWSRKETGRPSHGATERDTIKNPIPNDEKFRISGTGFDCDHPRDASLPPGHSVNCACTTIARFEGDTIKTVLARYLKRGFLTYEQLTRRDAQHTARN